jgi:hypothetical protein
LEGVEEDADADWATGTETGLLAIACWSRTTLSA